MTLPLIDRTILKHTWVTTLLAQVAFQSFAQMRFNMVEAVGLEPTRPSGGWFTVSWGYQFSYTSIKHSIAFLCTVSSTEKLQSYSRFGDLISFDLIGRNFAACVEAGTSTVASLCFLAIQSVFVACIMSTAIFGTASSVETTFRDDIFYFHQIFIWYTLQAMPVAGS